MNILIECEIHFGSTENKFHKTFVDRRKFQILHFKNYKF